MELITTVLKLLNYNVIGTGILFLAYNVILLGLLMVLVLPIVLRYRARESFHYLRGLSSVQQVLKSNERLQAEFKQLEQRFRLAETSLSLLHQKQTALEKYLVGQQQSQLSTTSQVSQRFARHLLQAGGSLEEVIKQCNLSMSEVEMLSVLPLEPAHLTQKSAVNTGEVHEKA